MITTSNLTKNFQRVFGIFILRYKTLNFTHMNSIIFRILLKVVQWTSCFSILKLSHIFFNSKKNWRLFWFPRHCNLFLFLNRLIVVKNICFYKGVLYFIEFVHCVHIFIWINAKTETKRILMKLKSLFILYRLLIFLTLINVIM